MLIAAAMLVSVLAALLSYPVPGMTRAPRLATLAVLAAVAAAGPLLVAPEHKLTRFLVGLFALMMILKIWDLHLGASRGGRPGPREFVKFVANAFFLVWRRRGAEPQPAGRRIARDLLVAMASMAACMTALHLVARFDWPPWAFMAEHTLLALLLLAFVIAEIDFIVAVTRALGGYIVAGNDKPWLSRTPAQFWRRYNRVIGSFLHEDVFKPLDGRRHPVRATVGAFAVSGVIHEYLFWLAIGRSAGLQMVFFLLQGLAVAATARVKPRGNAAIAWTLGTWVFLSLSSVFFFASFHHMVPMYTSLPRWLAAW